MTPYRECCRCSAAHVVYLASASGLAQAGAVGSRLLQHYVISNFIATMLRCTRAAQQCKPACTVNRSVSLTNGLASGTVCWFLAQIVSD